MDHISSLFVKITQRIKKGKIRHSAIKKILAEKLFIETSLDNIKIQGDIAFIKNISPVERNEIMFQKQKIMSSLKKEGINLKDIR